MSALFASDLDETLLFRLHPPRTDHVVVEPTRIEAPIGMTRIAHAMLTELNTAGLFAPVTARSITTYSRIAMPGGTPEWAAVAAGGVLLHHGKVDDLWAEKQASRLGLSAPMAEMYRLLATTDGLAEPRIIDGSYVLARIEDPERFAPLHSTVQRVAKDGGWGASIQHTKVHLFPEHVSKAAAVAEIRERSGADWVVAAGDSLMDAAMLLEADRALMPGAGELHAARWSGPRVQSVGDGGPASGEAILRIARAWLAIFEEVLLVSRRAKEGTSFLE